MAYTILIKPNNTALATVKQTIMQRDKLVDNMRVVTARYYNDYDMSEFQLIMTYLTPISKTVRIVNLEIESNDYGDTHDMLSYLLTVDTPITAENGDVKIQFMFVKTVLNDEGRKIQYVRNIDETQIHICQLSDWLTSGDEALSTIAKLFLQNQENIKALGAVADDLDKNVPVDMAITNETLALTGRNGEKIGNGVSLEDLNDSLVEVGANTSGNIKIVDI